MSSAALVDAATEMADNGRAIFPVARNKRPVWNNAELGRLLGRTLKPNEGGLNQATDDPELIERLFAHPATWGVGMPTGSRNQVTVVDVDCGRGKRDMKAAAAWLDNHRPQLRGASVVRTASGGLHYWCRYTPGIASAAKTWGPGVDCRNDGGYVVIPPTPGYRWEKELDPDIWPAPPPPVAKTRKVKDVADPMVPGSGRAGETPPHVLELIEKVRAGTEGGGGWHDAVRDLTAWLFGCGWNDAAILRYVCQWTARGYTHRETFEDVAVMIDGARTKWAKDQALLPGDLLKERIAQDFSRLTLPNKRLIIELALENVGVDPGILPDVLTPAPQPEDDA